MNSAGGGKFINTSVVGEENESKEGKWGAGGRGRDFPNCLVTGKVKSSSYEMAEVNKETPPSSGALIPEA